MLIKIKIVIWNIRRMYSKAAFEGLEKLVRLHKIDLWHCRNLSCLPHKLKSLEGDWDLIAQLQIFIVRFGIFGILIINVLYYLRVGNTLLSALTTWEATNLFG